MKKKFKWVTLLVATTLLLAACTEKEEEKDAVNKPQEITVNEEENVDVTENKEGEVNSELTQNESEKYLKLEGKGSTEEERTNGTRYIAVGETSTEYGILITEDVNVFDNVGEKTELKVKENFAGYTRKDRPMIMIYPPQYSPEVIIVNKDGIEGLYEKVVVGEGDITKDNRFKLNISEETVFVNTKGETIEKTELKEKEIVFFYDVSTRSIPAQVTPKKIMILE